MGTVLYLTFEKSLPELDALSYDDGKSLAKNNDALAEAAERLGVSQLQSFVAMSNDEMAAMLGMDLDELADMIPEAEKRRSSWFSASAGLKTATALLRDVRARPKKYERPQRLADELERVVAALRLAAKKKVRFCLKVDI